MPLLMLEAIVRRIQEIWPPLVNLLLFWWLLERIPPMIEAYSVSHTFRFPHVPFRSGVHHIHSPEYFLEAHGICPPGFVLESTSAPVRVGTYHMAAFRFRTLLGPMEGRVFSNNRTSSELLPKKKNLTQKKLH